MDLVDEDNSARAILARPFSVGHDLLDFLDAGQHSRELDELSFGHARNDLRQRGLAGSRRSPEDEGARIVALDLNAERFAGSDQMLLAHKFIKRPGTHAVSERTVAVSGGVAARDGLE